MMPAVKAREIYRQMLPREDGLAWHMSVIPGPDAVASLPDETEEKAFMSVAGFQQRVIIRVYPEMVGRSHPLLVVFPICRSGWLRYQVSKSAQKGRPVEFSLSSNVDTQVISQGLLKF